MVIFLQIFFLCPCFQDPTLTSLISEGAVFEVPVTKAVQLTKEDAVKTALLLELDISVSWWLSSQLLETKSRKLCLGKNAVKSNVVYLFLK